MQAFWDNTIFLQTLQENHLNAAAKSDKKTEHYN